MQAGRPAAALHFAASPRADLTQTASLPMPRPASLLRWLRRFAPESVASPAVERLRAWVGVLLGLLIVSLAVRELSGAPAGLPLLVAPICASAVLVFVFPASPMAQPWPVLGGNLVGALAGVACARWVADPVLAAPLAVGGALAAMVMLRCLHAPGGAVAAGAVMGGPAVHALGWRYALSPVAVESALLVLAALVYNNATRHRYPGPRAAEQANPHRTADRLPGERLGFTSQDLDAALDEHSEALDVSRGDLEALLHLAEQRAWRRRFGDIRCADIMSRDLVTVESGTPLRRAWALLRAHKIRSLPVIDGARRLVGIVTVADFLKHADLERYDGWQAKLRRFVGGASGPLAGGPESVGRIMTTGVRTVQAERPMVELVPLMSDAGLHHIPVVDGDGRLVGIVTQSDLISALYHGRLADFGPAAPSRGAAAQPAASIR